MFGSPPRFQTSSEARAVQLMPPCSQQLSAGKATGLCLLLLSMHAYIHIVVLMHVLLYVPPRVCSTAPPPKSHRDGSSPEILVARWRLH